MCFYLATIQLSVSVRRVSPMQKPQRVLFRQALCPRPWYSLPINFQSPTVDSNIDSLNHVWGFLIGVGKLGNVLTWSSEDAIMS